MTTNAAFENKLGFLSSKILHHIEEHSDILADGLWGRIEKCLRLREYREKVPEDELRQRVYEIYSNLGDWLQRKSEKEVEHRYVAIGERRAGQNVPLSQVLLAIDATKEHIWEHITEEVMTENEGEVFQVLELSRSIEMFFDRATYFAAIGHERYHAARHRAAAAPARVF
jgi:hypothetical protein